MMHRNLDRRVEALVQLTEPEHLREIDDLFDEAMSDAVSAWRLAADGTWERRHRTDAGEALVDLQDSVMTRISRRKRNAR